MTTNAKPTHEQPGGLQDENVEPDDGVPIGQFLFSHVCPPSCPDMKNARITNQ